MPIAPELRIAIFGFLTAFVWEMWQMPFYAQSGREFLEIVKGCSLASLGDAGLMVLAYSVASRAANTRYWLLCITNTAVVVYLTTGLLITIGIEQFVIRTETGWQYGDLMPLEPIFGTGLVPLGMWIVVPLITLWLARLEIAKPD